MTPDLVALLCSRYPRIFPAGRLPRRSGIGNGWFGVLDAVSFLRLMEEASEWWRRDLQIVQIRDVAEFPTRSWERP